MSENEELDLERINEINEHALDTEWKYQSTNYQKLSKLVAAATKIKDKEKEKLDLLCAELDTDIRKDPSKYGVEKITETVVKNAIVQIQDYGDQFAAYLDAKEDEQVLSGALKALEHKKKALEKLSELWIAGYYSEPNIPKEAQQQTAKIARQEQSRSLKGRVTKRRRTNEKASTDEKD